MNLNIRTPPILTGEIRGKLKILYRLHNVSGHFYLCQCLNCGALVEAGLKVLHHSNIKKKCIQCKSCHAGRQFHGKTKTRLYSIWTGMKNRADNHDGSRPSYDGKTICNEWKSNFVTFYNWAIDNGYQENLTIDRIDNDKGYSPDNCRWSTTKQQVRNRSNTKRVTYKGETKPLIEWCELLDLNYSTVWRRLDRSWPIEEAFKKGAK